MRRLFVGAITNSVYGQFASRTTAPSSQRQSRVEIGEQPKKPTDDGEARLHHVAPLIGRLPLGEERAIVELKARWLLGDVDVDRCPREHGSYRERKFSNQH
jgi:hypothetical protein